MGTRRASALFLFAFRNFRPLRPQDMHGNVAMRRHECIRAGISVKSGIEAFRVMISAVNLAVDIVVRMEENGRELYSRSHRLSAS